MVVCVLSTPSISRSRSIKTSSAAVSGTRTLKDALLAGDGVTLIDAGDSLKLLQQIRTCAAGGNAYKRQNAQPKLWRIQLYRPLLDDLRALQTAQTVVYGGRREVHQLGQILKPQRGVLLNRVEQGEIFSVELHKTLYIDP